MHRLFHCKKASVTIDSVTADKDNPRRLWRTLNHTLGMSDSPNEYLQSAEDLAQFFDNKVRTIRQSTVSAPPPSFCAQPPCLMQPFTTVSVEDVVKLISNAPCKSSQLDPMPTWLLKKCSSLLGPFLTELFNASLTTGIFPTSMKLSVVTPLLKKPTLDRSDCASFRPVSNLSFVSKLLEKIVSGQITIYLESNNLLPTCQSAYRACHSTETALLRVFSDLVEASDKGNVSLLTLLDLSAAFDTVDHDILICRLERDFGLHVTVINWIHSYLSDRKQIVKCAKELSSMHVVTCGVPQGSVLGPLLFIMYTAHLQELITSQGLKCHSYADDSQIYGSCRPGDSNKLKDDTLRCVDAVSCWMKSNRLKLNQDKTEFMWCSTDRQRHLVDNSPLIVDGVSITPSTSVCLLGVIIDCELSLTAQVSETVRTGFYYLRRLNCVRRSLPMDAAKMLVNSFVVSRVDYCNGVLAGITQRQCDRMQSVLNASARLLYGGKFRDHVTPLLRDKLHWLKFRQRVQYKLCLTVYKTLNHSSPAYISELIQPPASARSARNLRSSDTRCVLNPTSKKKFGDRGFSVAGPSAWNSLPASVRMASSINAFKSNLKTVLFNASYY